MKQARSKRSKLDKYGCEIIVNSTKQQYLLHSNIGVDMWPNIELQADIKIINAINAVISSLSIIKGILNFKYYKHRSLTCNPRYNSTHPEGMVALEASQVNKEMALSDLCRLFFTAIALTTRLK